MSPNYRKKIISQCKYNKLHSFTDSIITDQIGTNMAYTYVLKFYKFSTLLLIQEVYFTMTVFEVNIQK